MHGVVPGSIPGLAFSFSPYIREPRVRQAAIKLVNDFELVVGPP